jgi:hypothetical protein
MKFVRKYFFIAIVLLTNCVSGLTQGSSQKPIVLRGTIILPNKVIKHGYVAIVNGRIASVSEDLPDIPGAITVNTHGIILPGFVDVHNHVRFNVLPRWKPTRLFTNRNQWRVDPEVLRLVNGPINNLSPSRFCDMNSWGELRALVGGTTSIMTTNQQPCIHGLVRNLDFNSGFYGTTQLDREHIYDVLEIPTDPAQRAFFVGGARSLIQSPFYEALFIHLAEGTDAAAEDEFTFVQSQSLLNPKGVVIHGIPLSATDFQDNGLFNGYRVGFGSRDSNLPGSLYGQNSESDSRHLMRVVEDCSCT